MNTIESVYAEKKEIFRFANRKKKLEALKSLGVDPDSVSDVLNFLGPSAAEEDPQNLLDAPFESKPQLEQNFGNSSRFSDGSWPVFYAALEESTALEEVKHHFLQALLGDPSSGRRASFEHFQCNYTGTTKNLCSKQSEWPDLTSDDYEFCQRLGRQAVNEKLDGFFAPSAKRIKGTTVPVFIRKSLSQPRPLGITVFTLDRNRGDIVKSRETT
ncbi:MAG: RES family NAD+ phosphorylase [Nitrospinaceae bacterium]